MSDGAAVRLRRYGTARGGGTTRLPKGARVTHRARSITAQTPVIEQGLDERDVIAKVTPMFHIAALNLTYQPAIMIRATVVFARKWQITDFAELCQKQADTAPFLSAHASHRHPH